MNNKIIEEYIIDALQNLKVFTYSEFEQYLQDIPDSNYKSECIQRIFENTPLRQVFEYFIYVG